MNEIKRRLMHDYVELMDGTFAKEFNGELIPVHEDEACAFEPEMFLDEDDIEVTEEGIVAVLDAVSFKEIVEALSHSIGDEPLRKAEIMLTMWQWLDADGLDDIERHFELTKGKDCRLMVFITTVLANLKNHRRMLHRNHNCICFEDVLKAADEAWEPDVYKNKLYYLSELLCCLEKICPKVN